ncbi:MAG: N-methyl-D-aspartate receptor NMDAR2C subunit [Planctomycetes bacterium]|nr:N-methyl-D-aspartate receptor NMDAR2C subunit [Planctomycetota bacterium]
MFAAAAWESTWHALGVRPPAGLHAELVEAWREKTRHYHTLQHLEECLASFERVRALAKRPAEVELALWFHDALYDVRRHDNEERSAEWAHAALRAAGAEIAAAARVRELVLATRHGVESAALTPDARLVIDVDLAILGAPRERFDEYEAQIRAEYAWVPEFLFRTKRREILAGFLARPRIFTTDAFHAEREARARENLARALAGRELL